jgi:hypothetical protein
MEEDGRPITYILALQPIRKSLELLQQWKLMKARKLQLYHRINEQLAQDLELHLERL